jgi:AcrR family transcriptional regulator
MATSTTDPALLRSDARRNRERIVAAARELFARDGVEASVEDITREAGVGMGTLYRHFPTKDELIDAVLEDALSDMVVLAEDAAAEEDAWVGFTGFLERALQQQAANRGLRDVLATRADNAPRIAIKREHILPALQRVIERAHEQGSLRPDFAAEDLPLLFWASDRVMEATSEVAPDYWRRYVALLLDGLRAGSATRLPGRPLTRSQLARAARRRA